MLPALHSRSSVRVDNRASFQSQVHTKNVRHAFGSKRPSCARVPLPCRATADALNTAEPVPASGTKKDPQQHDGVAGQSSTQQQQQQQQLLQQQAQEGLLGPVDPPAGFDDHPLEVDRVVERDLLDSNGEHNVACNAHLASLQPHCMAVCSGVQA